MVFGADPVPPGRLARDLDASPRHAMTPGEYWPRLQPLLRSFGITRVADITGLDAVGFPVAQAVRPWARSNAVTQGKGATLDAAAIGAVLECLEMCAGEDLHRFPTVPQSDAKLWAGLAPGHDWPRPDTEFIAAWNLAENAPATVPKDVVSTDYSHGAPAEAAPILRQSTGLGAGASRGAAMLHGLLEVIEADARLRSEHAGTPVPLTLDPSDPDYGPILRLTDAAALRVAVEDISRNGVWAVKASVMEKPGTPALPLPALGYAARFDLGAAIAAALAEALQARLAVISGAREDITWTVYDHRVPPDLLADEWHRHRPRRGRAAAAPSRRGSLRDLARRVAPVLAVPLVWDPRVPLAIVRVVAPGLVADPLRLGEGG